MRQLHSTSEIECAQPERSKALGALIFLWISSFIYRYIIFIFYGHETFYGNPEDIYVKIVYDKFLSVLSYEHTKPLTRLIQDYIAISIFNDNFKFGNLIILSFLNILVASIVFKLCCAVTSKIKLSIALATALSFSLVTWEYWRQASHFDHLFVPIFTLCLHSTFLLQNKFKNIFYFFISHILLVSSHPFGIALAIVSVFIASPKNLKLKLILNFAFVLSYALLSQNNFKNYSIPLLSTVGGQNQLQLVWFKQLSAQDLFSLLEKNNFPGWYQECFRNAYSIGGKTASIYGLCYANPLIDSLQAREYIWGLLAKSNDENLIRAARSDLELLNNEPFHLLVGVVESKLGVSVHYGRYSSKLARLIVKEHPFQAVKAIFRSHIYTLFHSTTFLTGMYYEPQLILLPAWHKTLSSILLPIFLTGFLFSYVFLLASIINSRRYPSASKISRTNKAANFIAIFCSVYIVFLVTAFSVSTCCENGRMTVGILPLALLLAVTALNGKAFSLRRFIGSMAKR